MRALVKYDHGPGKIEVRDVEEPHPAPNEAIIEVEAAGICGTDLHIQNGSWSVNPPVIMGHEFSGRIVQLGNGVMGWSTGDRVVSEVPRVCGTCEYCVSGNYHLCDQRKAMGYAVDGAFTKLVAVPSRNLHKLPHNLTSEEAAIVEPLADVMHAMLAVSQVKPGDSVAIVGPGPIGLLGAQVAKACGAIQVVVTGLSKDAERLNLAEKLGATTINVDEQDPIQRMMSSTSGRGFDLVLEASGSPSGATLALSTVRKKGQVTLIGLHSREAQVDLNRIVQREIRLAGSWVNVRDDWDRALRIVSAGLVHLKPLISGTFRLEEWQQAFELCRAGRAIKVLLIP